VATLLAAAALLLAAFAAPWARLREPAARNVFGATLAALAVLWQIRFAIDGGLLLHFSGAAVLALLCGMWLAWIGLAAVATAGFALAALQGAGAFGWSDWGLQLIGFAFVPAALTRGVARLLARHAPAHPFVYIFGNGFFGAGLALAAGGAAAGALALAGGRIAADALLDVWLPAVLLLAFSEAWLSGMVVTLLVVYRPHWLVGFDPRRYLSKSR
jgi:uncharacterized membrane protein